MPIPDDVRGVAMLRRVEATARSLGVSSSGRWLLGHAARLALERRRRLLDDDHDPHYLHAPRSALVLLLDTGELNALLPAAAALAESERDDLRVPDADVLEGSPPDQRAAVERVLSLRAELDPPAGTDLLEHLVGSEEAVRRVALAERLDHIRHVHMVSDEQPVAERLTAALHEVERVWLPVAERTHARLARRFRHWALATRRRLAREHG